MKGDMEKSDNGRGEEENDALRMRKKSFLADYRLLTVPVIV